MEELKVPWEMNERKGGQPGLAVPRKEYDQLSCLRSWRQTRMTEKRRRAAALQKLLLGRFDLCGFDFGSGVGVLFGETLDAAGGVNQLLLAGEERVAA